MDDRFAEFKEDVDMVKLELKVGMRLRMHKSIVDEDDDEVERPNRQLTPVFKRLYIRLDAQKQGFVQGCRPVVGLDGELKFEVDCYDTTHVVDLRAIICGCKDWDLTGIPCKHAVSCIYLTREKPEAYVHNYFSKETYLMTYSFMINPVPGEHDWIETGYDAIAPPYYRKPAERPRKREEESY
ncbi:hypothetical protein ACSBR1_032553 [Camellia fascicularis]